MSDMHKFKPIFRRLIAIDQEIRKGQFPNCSRLAELLETSAKTIQRDLDCLRDDHGAPLEYDSVRHGYYYTDPSWFLPALHFSEGDMLALLLGQQALRLYEGTPLAGQLQRVYARIAELLPEKLSIPPELLMTRFSFANAPARPIDTAIWLSILRGLLHQRILETTYRSPRRPGPRAHRLRPYHVVNIEGDWYVLAFDEEASDVRQFAMSRFERVVVSDIGFTVPADFSAAALLSGRQGRFVRRQNEGTATPVRLRFNHEAAPYVRERQWHPDQEMRERSDGSLDVAIPVQHSDDIIPWIMSYGPQVEVLSPKAVREHVKARLRSALGRYIS